MVALIGCFIADIAKGGLRIGAHQIVEVAVIEIRDHLVGRQGVKIVELLRGFGDKDFKPGLFEQVCLGGAGAGGAAGPGGATRHQ